MDLMVGVVAAVGVTAVVGWAVRRVGQDRRRAWCHRIASRWEAAFVATKPHTPRQHWT